MAQKEEEKVPEKEEWFMEKVMACLQRVVHQDVLFSLCRKEKSLFFLRLIVDEDLAPQMSQEEFDSIRNLKVFDLDLIDFLKYIYEKSNNKLEIYGTANRMLESLMIVNDIPEYVKFSSSTLEISTDCALLRRTTGYKRNDEHPDIYSSQSDNAIRVFREVTFVAESFGMSNLAMKLFEVYHIAHLNKILREMKGSLDFVLTSTLQPFFDELEQFRIAEPDLTAPIRDLTIDSLFCLRRHFHHTNIPFYREALNDFDNEIQREIANVGTIYCESSYLMKNCQRIYRKYAELFIPYAKIRRPVTIQHEPLIRSFENEAYEFFFSAEIRNAMQKLMDSEAFEKAKNLVIVESDEERKNGIIYATQPGEREKLQEQLKCNLIKIGIALKENYQYIVLPVLSPYGTHCVPSFDAFSSILYYLANILKVFQRAGAKNIDKVVKWVDDEVCSFFVKRPVLYLIEIWKIDEIIRKARRKLSPYLVEPEYEVVYKSDYERNDVFAEFFALLKNLKWPKMGYYTFALTVNHVFSSMPPTNKTIRHLYNGCAQMVQLYFETSRPNVAFFIQSQWTKYYYENVRRKEARKRAQEASCSTKNVENPVEKEKKSERCCLKTLNESSERENQQQDQLELEKKAKELQLKTSPIGSEKQIQKDQEDLKKTQEAEPNLEKTFKTPEPDLRDEIRSLKEAQEKTDKKLKSLEADLAKEKAEKVNLKKKTETLEKKVEELNAKVGKLMSKVGKH